MYRHIRLYCKVALTGINKEESIQLKFQNQINHLSNTVDTLLKQNIELKKEKNIIQPILTNVQNIETQNVQNIETANVQNNNITINILPFPEMNIKHDDILNPFLKENSASYEYAKIPYLDKVDVAKNDANNQLISTALVEMVENVYSESENRNIYFLKKDKVMVYQKDGIWCIKSLDNANREICGSMMQKCKNMRGKINFPKDVYPGDKESINETFRTLPTEYENNTSKILKNVKPELSIFCTCATNKDKLKNNKLI
jgi:hypothetical protein